MYKSFIIAVLLLINIIPSYANDLGKILGGLVAGYIIYEAIDNQPQTINHYYITPPRQHHYITPPHCYHMPPPPMYRYPQQYYYNDRQQKLFYQHQTYPNRNEYRKYK